MSSLIDKNYFELFELPVSFETDLTVLRDRFRELQRATHPDRFAGASSQERRMAMQLTTRVNEAYQVLSDPVSRARYLLELAGVQWGDDQHTVNDTAFLMAQMELREELDELKAHGFDEAALAGFRQRVQEQVDEITATLAEQLGSTAPETLQQARHEVSKLQFFSRLQQQVDELEESLF
jgi:molecular chaperone HscB